jgi:hypothetical protein
MAMAIAMVSTTSPASCPPMIRVLSGRVADVSRVFERFRTFLGWGAAVEGGLDAAGETVGNSPDGLLFGKVNAPKGLRCGENGGSWKVGRIGTGDAEGALTETLTVAAERAESAILPRAVAVSVMCSPDVAPLPTKRPATSSSL